MSDKVRIADLPTSTNIDKDCYMIVERPGVGEGTYKTTLGEIQEATTVTANVTQSNNITTIYIKDVNGETSENIVTPIASVTQENNVTTISIDDVNGHTSESIVTPTAKVVENDDNTFTITITDASGKTTTTGVSRVIFDPVPTEGSSNMVSSGTMYQIMVDINASFNEFMQSIDNKMELIEQSIQSELENIRNDLDHKFEELESEVDERLQSQEQNIARSLVVQAGQPVDTNQD